ncbi:MAG: xanthine dehydrogenase accessory protein XdhC [Bdellovibrionales bacterium]|jgi:xanthine dehydrogenase accessory factor|nr:xanthine dehydrogenase accessory protein XdhC [Bdellovibrionales bacterium]
MNIWQKIQELDQCQISFILVTQIASRGGAPQDTGAKCIVTSNGLSYGTVGGGKVEARAIELSKELLLTEKQLVPQVKKWNLQKDIGMTCGGEVTFLFEHFPSKIWPIVIFGAGHVAQALTRILSTLNCQITCIDTRQEWLDKLDNIDTICHENPKDLVKTLNPNSFFISMTKGHAFDLPIVHEISKLIKKPKYIGIIGSESKGKVIKKDLIELNVSQDFIDNINIPIGLPLGSNHVYEIAISIATELLQKRDQQK